MLHFLRKSKKLRYSRKPFTMSFMLKEATGSAKNYLGPYSYQHPTLFYYGIDIFLLEISSNKEPKKIRGWTAMVSCWLSTMVFCYQNSSNLLWEKIVLVIKKKLLKFEAEGREFAKFLRSLEQLNLFKQWKVRTIFGNRMLF